MAVSVARAAGHSLTALLPTVEDMARSFEVDFPPLNRVDDPIRLQQHEEWRLKRGLTNDAEILRRSRPELSLEEAREEILVNLEIQSEFNGLKASRRMDPAAEMQSEPEETGKEGGQASPDDSEKELD